MTAIIVATAVMAVIRNVLSIVSGFLFVFVIIFGILALWKWYKCGRSNDD